MKLIKLDAIDSTNDFLKDLSRSQKLDNFTVVLTKNQTNGKGQMGSKWESEAGKNLTFSVLIIDLLIHISEIYCLNVAVALSVLQVLKSFKIPNLTIKWPNDIMADSKKIGGILIENSFKSDKKIESIVGIGLNVNQINFLNLSNATSMAKIMGIEFELEQILNHIIVQIKFNFNQIIEKKQHDLWKLYHKNLFKINVPLTFEDANQSQFMAIIQGVTAQGQLKILDCNDEIKSYSIKEIKILF